MRKRLSYYAFALLLSAVVSGFTLPVTGAAAAQAENRPEASGQPSPAEVFAKTAEEAKKGNARAMLSLGNCYEHGIGTQRDFIKALEWYEKAADEGLPEGWYNLGVSYEVGMGNPGDMKKAIRAYEKAADKDLVPAHLKLSSFYFSGTGVKKDIKKGMKHLTAAAGKGNPEASNSLGVIYMQGMFDQPKDEIKAYEYFLQAADAGHLEAIKNIAVIYKDGYGRNKDLGVALQWYLIAQKGGYQRDLGPIIKELRSSLNQEQVKRAEQAADKWLKYFTEKTG